MYTECPQCGGDVVDDGLRATCLDCGKVVRVHQKVRTARRRNNRIALACGALVLISIPVFFVWGVLTNPPGNGVVEGSMQVTGGPLGELRFAPTECIAAERIVGVRFAGVALLGSQPDTVMIRVVRHPHHTGAKISRDLARDVVISARTSPQDPWQEITLTPKSCPGLVVKLEPFSAWWFAESSAERNARYQGAIEADCKLEGSGRITMSIRFEHCRRNPHMDRRSVE